jgi:hypothetical protein
MLLHLLTYVVVVGILIAVNALIGGRSWSLWIAAVWGGFLLLRFVVATIIWRMLGPRWSKGEKWRGSAP